MQIKENNNIMETYRPPQACLNHFWTLTDGDDASRVEAAVQLVKMIQSVEKKSEREEITTYCVNRLVRGLGSGRKFARVGFSTALTLLLRLQSEVQTSQVLACFNDKLRAERNAFSKSEKAALYLGRAFAISSIIQSGRISQLNEEILGSVVGELLTLSAKRSFLRPVCSKALQQLIMELSDKSFADIVWPRVRSKLVSAWEGCTLDRISLLLACKDKFPDVVNKKFIKKHWGSSLFSEDNDEKLIQALQISTEKSNAMREIWPSIIGSGRDALSLWKGIGDKMISGGKDRVITQQQLIALEFLGNLIKSTSTSEQTLALLLDPSVTKAIFMENHTDNQVLGKVLDSLVSTVFDKLKTNGGDVLEFVQKILELEGGAEDEEAKAGKLSFVHSHSFGKIVSLMSKSEMEAYADLLISFIKGKDDVEFLSETGKKRRKQLDWCFRQLQHMACSQTHTTKDMQQTVLALFLRNGFFNGTKKNTTILHCDFVDRFVETIEVKRLCELFLFKSLDQLSTMKADQSSKSESFSRYTDLLSYLVHYFQSLISCQDVTMTLMWSDQTKDVWKQLMKRINSIEKGKGAPSPSFRLLYLYMAFYLLSDVKTATDLLQDIFICQDKSLSKDKKSKKDEGEDDPYWTEVLTEILLQLLSLPSHLARVIASKVFDLIIPEVNSESVAIITQVLIPNKNQPNVTFDDDEEGERDDEDENGILLDDDIPSEESSDDDDDEEDNEEGGDEEDEEEEKEDEMDVDEQFRASVKEVLGKAAVDEEEDDDVESLPDMSDSEMFKIDEVLAEVFRQRKRLKGGKKVQEQKRKEMGNFRLRVLDLVDVVIKSDRCSHFLFDLLKPLLVLMFTSTREEEQAGCNRAKASFQILKTKCKGMTVDSKSSKEEQTSLFQELLDLAKKVTESSQLQQIASACVLMIKVSKVNCLGMLQDTLNNIINKSQSKPLPSFFISLMETDPVLFKPLCANLIDCLKNESAKKQCKSMACTLLTSLVKKSGHAKDTSAKGDSSWMAEAAQCASQLVLDLTKENAKGLLVKELLTLTLALVGRTDTLTADHFDSDLKQKLMDIKSKMGTDTRKVTNKIIAALDRISKQGQQNGKVEKSKKLKEKKKRKAEVLDEEEQEQVEKETDSPKHKKKKRRKLENDTE